MNMNWHERFSVEKSAEDLASSFYYGTLEGKSQKITAAQLRKFYNEFKSLERKYQLKSINSSSEEAFTAMLPHIKINKAKVGYARARKTVPDEFVSWLQRAVDDINSPEAFEAFLLHFEAIVGYAYGLGLKD